MSCALRSKYTAAPRGPAPCARLDPAPCARRFQLRGTGSEGPRARALGSGNARKGDSALSPAARRTAVPPCALLGVSPKERPPSPRRVRWSGPRLRPTKVPPSAARRWRLSLRLRARELLGVESLQLPCGCGGAASGSGDPPPRPRKKDSCFPERPRSAPAGLSGPPGRRALALVWCRASVPPTTARSDLSFPVN